MTGIFRYVILPAALCSIVKRLNETEIHALPLLTLLICYFCLDGTHAFEAKMLPLDVTHCGFCLFDYRQFTAEKLPKTNLVLIVADKQCEICQDAPFSHKEKPCILYTWASALRNV